MANFNFYLNRQGVRGRQGVKGDKGEAGYSPYIDIKSNTPTEFIMTIHNETESFDTPNLIPTAIGEKVTEMDAVLTTHTEDIANLKLEDQNINTNITSLQGNLTNLSEEVNTLSGEVASNSADITAIKNKNNAQDSDIAKLKTRVGGTEESIEDLNHKYTVLGSEVSDLTRTKQNRLVEGANITLTNNDDGTTTISSTGGGGGSSSPLDSYIEGSTTASVTTISAKNGKALELSAPTIAVGDNLVNEINGANTQLYLKQGDIAAGDNITVEKTATGVKVSSTGGGSSEPPANMVTTDTNQTVSGVKTFTNRVEIGISGLESMITTADNSESGRREDLLIMSSGDLILNTGEVGFTDDDGGEHIRQGKITDGSGNIVLTQGNVTAGNNITITKTSKGIKIDGSGGGGEAPANMVTTDTDQDITGVKRFLSNRQVLSKPAIKIGSYAAGQDTYDGGYITSAAGIFEIGSYYDTNSKGGFLSINSTANSSIFKITSNNSNINPRLQLGKTNYEGEIYNDVAEGLCLSNNKYNYDYPRSILKIKNDALTFTKTDGTVVDLLAGGGSSEPPTNMVTTDTNQFITGTKSFYGSINLKGSETDNHYSMITNTGGSLKLQAQYGDPAGLNIQTNDVQFIDSQGISHSLLSQSKLNADEYYYKAGDVFTTESYAVLPAIFSASKTQILMSIPMPKSMKNVSNISVTKCVLSVRVPSGGYLPSAHFDFLAEADSTTITTLKAMDNLLTLRIDKTGGWETQAANNIPLAVQISPAELIVEFN